MKKFIRTLSIVAISTMLASCGALSNISLNSNNGNQNGGENLTNLSGIEVSTLPTKMIYEQNEEFDPAGMVVSAVYGENNKEEITNYTVDPVDTSSVGKATVIVRYEGKTASFQITVIQGTPAKTATAIEVSSLPNKMVYFLNESFERAGMTVSLIYSDASRETITDYTIDSIDTSSVGSKTVTVRYSGFHASFNINVKEMMHYTLVTSTDDLDEGDKVVLVSNESLVAASGTITTSSSVNYLESLFSSNQFSSDKSIMTELNDDACVFTVGVSGDNYTFANKDGDLLGATAAKKLAWGSGYTSWVVEFNSKGDASITSSRTRYGTIYYNTGSPRFTVYNSTSTDFVSVQLYKVAAAVRIYPTDFSYSGLSSNTMKVGETAQLSLSYYPEETNKKIFSFESSDITVAAISASGSISAKKAGNTVITIKVQTEGGEYLTKTINLTVENVNVTSVKLSETSLSLGVGKSATLTASVFPSNATNKNISWSTSDDSVATVNNGKVLAVSAGNAVITITSEDGGFTATCDVEVIDTPIDAWTVLVYICGADLESGTDEYGTVPTAARATGLASSDIDEILSVSGQPDDVNIVVETGGANIWQSGHSYSISSSNLERWHVENKKLVKDESLSYASMGLSSTLQGFLEYGLTAYPAQKTALILWNHGGAMRGCCYDEKKNDDSLLTNEVATAVKNALKNSGKEGQKLEWIGYDCCLMQVQDIASINSQYFNYMIASEESESGYGWDYDKWVDDLYAKKDTESILKEIVDTFISENGGTTSSRNDQTLSYLDLSYMDEYMDAWEEMSTQLKSKITNSNKSNFNTLVKSAKKYADDEYGSYQYYGIFDAKDFINKLANNSTFNPGSTYTDAVIAAHSNFVKYSSCGRGAGNSYGLCLFWPCSSYCQKSSYYTSSMTLFTEWRSIVTTYGN